MRLSRAAILERAGTLEVLELQVVVARREIPKGPRPRARRLYDSVADPLCGFLDCRVGRHGAITRSIDIPRYEAAERSYT